MHNPGGMLDLSHVDHVAPELRPWAALHGAALASDGLTPSVTLAPNLGVVTRHSVRVYLNAPDGYGVAPQSVLMPFALRPRPEADPFMYDPVDRDVRVALASHIVWVFEGRAGTMTEDGVLGDMLRSGFWTEDAALRWTWALCPTADHWRPNRREARVPLRLRAMCVHCREAHREHVAAHVTLWCMDREARRDQLRPGAFIPWGGCW